MLRELVLKNRSYRGFDENVVITEDELRELVNLARVTPSGANLQPLKYKLVLGDKAYELTKCTRWAKRLSITLPREGHYPSAYIIVCADTEICKNPDACKIDVGIVAQTILFGAVEMGYGGCMLGNFDEDEILSCADLDRRYKPMLVIALGKPDENVVLVDATDDTGYYRDENDVHYVPKRTLSDIII